MDPITIGSLALGGGSLISGILGGNKQAKLAKQQMQNEKLLSDKQLQLAMEDQRLARASTFDELGNGLIYDPVSNTWKTTLSAKGQQISDGNVSEQLRQLQYDLPLARGEMIANAGQRSNERQMAGTLGSQLQDELSGRTATSGNSIASALSLGRKSALAAGQRQATKAFNTNAVRSGMSAGAAADALSSAGQDWADQAAQTMGNPQLEGRQMSDEMNQQKRGSLIDAYSAMASRAAGSPGASYTPSNQSSSLASTLAGSKNAALAGSAGASANIARAAQTTANSGRLIGAMTPDYSQLFNGANTLLQGFGGDIMSTLSNKYKNRGTNNTVAYDPSIVNMNTRSNSTGVF